MTAYAFWNNKGGVGKSFLSFVAATEYARKYPDTDVYVIDLCPQANISEMLILRSELLVNRDRDPLTPQFDAVHTLAKDAANNALKRFSTPNWENTRRILIESTGYDPVNDWSQPRMSSAQVRERLNQILQIRHSFAHGFSIPAYDWIQSPSGRVRLTSKSIRWIEGFFKNLVQATDNGMKEHVAVTYGLVSIW